MSLWSCCSGFCFRVPEPNQCWVFAEAEVMQGDIDSKELICVHRIVHVFYLSSFSAVAITQCVKICHKAVPVSLL